MTTRLGIVENVQSGHLFIRAESDWTRYFAAAVDCVAGEIPAPHCRVEFQPDEGTDRRGRRSRRVVVLADPVPTLRRFCYDCARRFDVDAGQQAWFAFKQFPYPIRCEGCRLARRSGIDHG